MVSDYTGLGREPARARPPMLNLVETMRRTIALMVEADPTDDEAAALTEQLQQFNDRLAACPRTEHPNELVHPLWGELNPIAPPLRLQAKDGMVQATAHVSRVYEIPGPSVQGGVIAALFDSTLARASLSVGRPAMTASLTVNYRKRTPARTDLRFGAKLERVQGRKSWVTGTLHAGDDLCADAEGLFVIPRERTKR